MSYTTGPTAPLGAFCNDDEIEALFTLDADLKQMIAYETALAKAQATAGLISKNEAEAIEQALASFSPDKAALLNKFHTDGVTPPALVAQMRACLEEPHNSKLHNGATSQDLIDTSAIIRLKKAVDLCAERTQSLLDQLETLAKQQSNKQSLQARTRMQNALPISVPEKIANWQQPLLQLLASKPTDFPLQLGGPEGALRHMQDDYETIAPMMAKSLGINAPTHHWQTNRQPILNIAFWFTNQASTMGKIASDILIMVQTEVQEVRLETGGSSSAMPHKVNPVLAEIILAQARYCQTQMSGMTTAAIHENERSGTAWTLEWMLLPQLVITAARTVSNMQNLIEQITFLPTE